MDAKIRPHYRGPQETVMMEKCSLSVCIATYNGAKYISEQISSILPQLIGASELVLVDDASSDETIAIVEGFHDDRIRVIKQTRNLGVVKTFERAISEAAGDVIFLSDQDDIWHPDKIATMMEAFAKDPETTLVLSNGILIDSHGRLLSQRLYEVDRFLSGVLANLVKNKYQGSTMAFRRKILAAALPFPDGIPMHDWWIGMVNAIIGRTVYLPQLLLFYRRHNGNVTSRRRGPMFRRVCQRFRVAWSLLLRLKSIMHVKRNLYGQGGGIASEEAREKGEASCGAVGFHHRAVVFAPFFTEGVSRPRFVGQVLAELMPVDVVTSDFDHSEKVTREPRQHEPFERVIYLKTRPYDSNVSMARLLSHILFSLEAVRYFKKNRAKYDVVYATVPLNVTAWLVFTLAGARTKIVDVVDIWPEVLPFPRNVKMVLLPIFAIWKWFFKSAVAKADKVMAVSDVFADEASTYANKIASVKRFYIGHERLESYVPKQSIFTIAYVGNLGRLYDFDALLDVLADDKLRDKVQLYVIGRGDREEWLLGELKRRMLRYCFFGPVFDPSHLADILRSCHIGFNGYVNTTAAFSYKATTYFAAGLPIINSMTGDLQNLVNEHRLGENYTGGNRQELSDCILRCVRSGTEHMASNCEEFFVSQLESSEIREDMKDFFLTKAASQFSGRIGVGVDHLENEDLRGECVPDARRK
jgi:glycosyltransferase involved in cell wall biosynthesis